MRELRGCESGWRSKIFEIEGILTLEAASTKLTNLSRSESVAVREIKRLIPSSRIGPSRQHVCVRMRFDLGWPPAPLWDAISYLALFTSPFTAATDYSYSVWACTIVDVNQVAQTIISCRAVRHDKLVCDWMRSNLGWLQEPN